MDSSPQTKAPNKTPIIIIGLVSALILLFLFWLIYFKEPPKQAPSGIFAKLPGWNAFFNAMSASFVAAGIVFIKRQQKKAHATCMIAATCASAAFLVGYLIHHSLHGDTSFQGTGWIRPVYFFILISHILLAMATLPMVLTTLYFAVTKRFRAHRKIARYTYPIWLYVSITGVLVFVFLRLLNPS